MLCVIGAGNVVRRRLLPALAWHGVDVTGLEVHGTGDDPAVIRVGEQLVPVTRHRVQELADVAAASDLPVWLATPPFDARRDLLEACRGRTLVCEKPLGMTVEDLSWLEENVDVLDRAFVLSYYVQEKLAPVLWLTGGLPVPAGLLAREAVRVDAGPACTPLSARMLLSEPLTRTAGDVVSPWQQQGGITEFAVHAPAMLENLGLPVDHVRVGRAAVTFDGPRSWARVVRPGPPVKRVVVETDTGRCVGDGLQRAASLDTGAGRRTASVAAACPAYGVVTAYALDWLAGGGYAGDGRCQVSALRAVVGVPAPDAEGLPDLA